MQSMKFIPPFLLLSFLFTLSLWSATPVPYSGKIDIRGVNYFGEAQFAFSLHDGNGTTHWRNGNQPKETIKVTIRNGRYTVLLGGQGMNSLAPELFLNHDKLYLKVEFDNEDGKGLRHLAPDQLITATPRALVAELAKVSEVAKVAQVAEKVGNGVITREMLSQEVLSQLDANATASPSAPITITRDMLPQDVRDDLNATIGMDRLSAEVIAKLDQNISGAGGVVAGSLISVPYGKSKPAGYSLYQRGTPKELVWEEKAPVAHAKYAHGGVSVLDKKLFFAGGRADSNPISYVEIYDPMDNNWEQLASLNGNRQNITSAVMANKLYVIGGHDGTSILSDTQVYDPTTDQWASGPSLPISIDHSTSISWGDKIYVFGGQNDQGKSGRVFMLNSHSIAWQEVSPMSYARLGCRAIVVANKIWVIGGADSIGVSDKIEVYDPRLDQWEEGPVLSVAKNAPAVWLHENRIFVAAGTSGPNIFSSSIHYYDLLNEKWESSGTTPEQVASMGYGLINQKIYLAGGHKASGGTNKVFAADLNASIAGVYDLYRKDGNASAGTPMVQAEVADGSVTSSKIASNTITTSDLSEQILKYLKPEITTQPQAQNVYSDTNASFSVTAEGKYLTYQWKKDGDDLAGENNATLTLTDANATLHDANYSVVVSNDFGSVESGVKTFTVLNSEMDGLVGWWKFDETNGTVAYDSSGNGNDGNLTNGPTWTTGKIGGALSFDGVNDFVSVAHSNGLNLVGAFSVSLWFKVNKYDGVSNGTYHEYDWSSLLTKGRWRSLQNWTLLVSKHPLLARFGFYGEDPPSLSPSFNLSLNNWCKVVVVQKETNEMYFYSNNKLLGVVSNEGVSSSSNTSHNLFIGFGNDNSYPYYLPGLIDDVRIYDRALSAAEVQALYNMGQ